MEGPRTCMTISWNSILCSFLRLWQCSDTCSTEITDLILQMTALDLRPLHMGECEGDKGWESLCCNAHCVQLYVTFWHCHRQNAWCSMKPCWPFQAQCHGIRRTQEEPNANGDWPEAYSGLSNYLELKLTHVGAPGGFAVASNMMRVWQNGSDCSLDLRSEQWVLAVDLATALRPFEVANTFLATKITPPFPASSLSSLAWWRV